MTDQTGIVTQNIVKQFDLTVAVNGVSLEAQTGELTGLIGADGAGKTTLLRMICGLLKQDAGEITIAGMKVSTDLDAKIKNLLGYMPQRFSLYPDLTVTENLRFFSDLFGLTATERKHREQRLYEFSRLGEFRSRPARALSGGMKQKLALCCNLIHEPKILVLDEPTFGVDPVSRQEFWEILRSLKAAGTAILVSTAYLDEAELCDQVYVMHSGKILLHGTPQAVRSRYPFRLYEYKIEQGAERSSKVIEAFSIHHKVHSVTRFGDRLHIAVSNQDDAKELLSLFPEVKLVEISPSIEDVFVTALQEQSGNVV